MLRRKKKSRTKNYVISSSQGTKFSKFVAFFVPFWFLSNLSGAITEFGFGIVNYHSYLLVLALYLILFVKNRGTRFILSREAFQYTAAHCFLLFVCLSSVVVVGGLEQSLDQFMSYAWMSLLGVGFVVTFRHTYTMPYLFCGISLATLIVCFLNTYEFLNPNFRVYANATGLEGQSIICLLYTSDAADE